ncbi:MAG TPA: isopeptide-forming domain-containing fimbrial protein [Solirubrobacteraceae bacterium]
MSASTLKTAASVTAAMALLVLLFTSQADAAMARWHLNTISTPASQPGGEGIIDVEAGDLGDAMLNATEHPVTIVDTLPAGLTITKVDGEGEGTTSGKNLTMQCPIAGQTVTCTFNGRLLAYERLIVVLKVKVTPGAGHGINEVTVAGGNAPSTSSRRTLALGDNPPAFGVQNYELAPEEEDGRLDTQAGSHPFQLTTTLVLNTSAVPIVRHGSNQEVVPQMQTSGAFTKDLHFNLPPGLVGNPTPLPKCPMSVFVEETQPGATAKCPDDTAVGVATPMVATSPETPTGSGSPLVFTRPLWSLEPSQGEPARFGFQTQGGPVILDTSVRTGGDYAVVVSVSDITQAVEFIGSQVTFWGVPSDPRHDTTRGSCLTTFKTSFFEPPAEVSCPVTEGQPFLVMPTSCTGPLHTTVEADRWAQQGQFVTKEYSSQNGEDVLVAQDGCNRLDFEPSINVSPDGVQGSSPTGLTVGVHVSQEASLSPTGLSESTVKDTTVVLPAGVTLNPAAADGLMACGLGEIALESPAEQSCPEASKVATVEIKTPLLPNPLVGAAYLATQNVNPFGSLIALYLVARDPVSGVLVKLSGQVSPDPVTGQLVSTFKDTPQLPFEDLNLHFFGGSRASLGTPAACGSYAASASFAPWSGNATANVSSPSFNISSGPNGSPCASPLPFAPSLTTGSLNLQAGAFTPLTTTMSREDGQQPLQGIQLHFPPGLSGLLSGVALCGEAQANEGACGPDSLIGETTVSVGLGGNPYAVKGGRVYITGPYKGAPFGLSIVNPAKAGPFDLGKGACDCVVVRAKVDVDPSSAALTITTDDTGPYKIPTILQGIPLQIKHVNVLITRPGFTINPTNCSKMAVTGAISSTEGASSSMSVPFQVTNCATLKFAPKFAVSTAGKTSRAKGASLAVKLTYPKAPFGSQANISKVKVDLPKQLPSRLTTLQKACTAAQFEANPAGCPAASLIGHATAITPLIPVPLTGPAYFVSHGGEAFPSLIVVLQGYGVTLDLVGSTFISHAGITSSTFKTVPDAPVGSFELILPQGKYSALAANGNLCKSKLAMPTAFVAQNGAEIHTSTKIAVTGCPKAKKATKKKHKGKGRGKGKKK